MKYLLCLFVFIIPFGCSSQSDNKSPSFEKAIQEYNLITSDQFMTLNCAETINKNRMLQFFKEYPQFNEDVRIVSIPNCYGAPNEEFFVLMYDTKREFYVPKSLPDVYRNDGK